MPGTGPLQIVQLDDVVANDRVFPAAAGAGARRARGRRSGTADLVEVVAAYRRWLGWGKPRTLRMPVWLAGLMYRLGDFAGLARLAPPIRTTAEREMVRGAVGDPSEWQRLTGIAPQALGEALAAQPPRCRSAGSRSSTS